MLERKHIDTNRTWRHNNTARQQDDPAPRRSNLARGEIAAVLLAALFVISLFLAPQITWAVGLVAGLIMLAVAVALGLRLWARDRISVNRAPPNGETSARPNGGTSARRRFTDIRSRIWLATRR
jgi:protein-S-isoprenylcysteine O-methyltransferase Ste14